MVQPLHVQSAVIHGAVRDLYSTDVVCAGPVQSALPVDMAGYAIWPALINAHDHLELNHYPRSKFREAYGNAHQWGEEMNARLDHPPYREGRAVPLADRLFIGGLKNLLCGALTVAHHNPLHRPLRSSRFPVRVLGRYGWAHSLHFEPDVAASYARTPADAPWFIHLAEGTDATAAAEYGRLLAKGAAGANTVLVHGVGMTPPDVRDAAGRVRGLVWCPSSNCYLLGRTADVRAWLAAGGCVALGSDSRLTADGDLLDEMRAALATGQVDGAAILAMVTTEAARLLGLSDVGDLQPGQRADWVATRAGEPLVGARRADLALVVRGGAPVIGDPELMARFPSVETVPATLDGRPKAIHKSLARRIMKCRPGEPGLTLAPGPRLRWGTLWRRGLGSGEEGDHKLTHKKTV